MSFQLAAPIAEREMPSIDGLADKVQPGSLGAVAYDDEGVKTKQWDLIRDGKLVDYQAIRDQAHILGKKESDGCCYADSWSSVQFQRMANVSLEPGKAKLSVAEVSVRVAVVTLAVSSGTSLAPVIDTVKVAALSERFSSLIPTAVPAASAPSSFTDTANEIDWSMSAIVAVANA